MDNGERNRRCSRRADLRALVTSFASLRQTVAWTLRAFVPAIVIADRRLYNAPRMHARLARTICPTILLWAVGCGAPQTAGTEAGKCRPFALYRGLPAGAPHANARVWVEDVTSPELMLDGVCMILDD